MPDPTVTLHLPCEHTQDELLCNLPWFLGQEGRPGVPQIILSAFSVDGCHACKPPVASPVKLDCWSVACLSWSKELSEASKCRPTVEVLVQTGMHFWSDCWAPTCASLCFPSWSCQNLDSVWKKVHPKTHDRCASRVPAANGHPFCRARLSLLKP